MDHGGGGSRWRLNEQKEARGGDNQPKNEKEKREHRVGPASRTYLQCSPVSQITDKCVSRCPVLHARIKSRRLIYKTDPPASTLSGEQLPSECDGEHAMTFLGRVSARPLLSQPPRAQAQSGTRIHSGLRLGRKLPGDAELFLRTYSFF